MYLHDNAILFEETLSGASLEYSVNKEFIAKDYWAMQVLKEVTTRNTDLVFKGGTCLSKCYGVINRFSEDIDLGIPYEHATEGMRKNIKRAVVDSTKALGIEITNLANTRSRREYNRYEIKPNTETHSLILETAVMTPACPYCLKTIQSFAGAFIEKQNAKLAEELGLLPFEVKSNSLERTFVDKIFIICDYYLSKEISARQSRHIYDLYKLFNEVELNEVMRKLVETVRAQRAGGYGNFSADAEVDLARVLRDIVASNLYRTDYEKVTTPLLYEDISYDEAISVLPKIANFLG